MCSYCDCLLNSPNCYLRTVFRMCSCCSCSGLDEKILQECVRFMDSILDTAPGARALHAFYSSSAGRLAVCVFLAFYSSSAGTSAVSVFLAVYSSSAGDLPDLPDRGRAVNSCVFYIPVKMMVGQLSAHLV